MELTTKSKQNIGTSVWLSVNKCLSFRSKDLMGHPDLEIDVSQFPPLLEPETIAELHNQ